MTRYEVYSTYQPSTQADRLRIERDTAEFLARGGKIDQQPILVRNPKADYKQGETPAEKKTRANNGSRGAALQSRTSSTLWVGPSAKYCLVQKGDLKAAVERGELKAEFSARSQRMRFQIVELDRWLKWMDAEKKKPADGPA